MVTAIAESPIDRMVFSKLLHLCRFIVRQGWYRVGSFEMWLILYEYQHGVNDALSGLFEGER